MLKSITTKLGLHQSRSIATPRQSSVRPRSGRPSSKPRDTFSRSGSVEEKPRDIKKMGLWAGIGAALGVAAAALLFPAAGLGAMLVMGGGAAVTGAAVADGALETAGTKPGREYDPFNPSHQFDPEFIHHPNNPNNPAFWGNISG